jgi:hypothetical protein
MQQTLSTFPDPVRMFELTGRMEAVLGDWDQLKNQIVTGPATKEIAQASNNDVQQQAAVAPPYPGEEAQHGNTSSEPPSPAHTDSATNTTPDIG